MEIPRSPKIQRLPHRAQRQAISHHHSPTTHRTNTKTRRHKDEHSEDDIKEAARSTDGAWLATSSRVPETPLPWPRARADPVPDSHGLVIARTRCPAPMASRPSEPGARLPWPRARADPVPDSHGFAPERTRCPTPMASRPSGHGAWIPWHCHRAGSVPGSAAAPDTAPIAPPEARGPGGDRVRDCDRDCGRDSVGGRVGDGGPFSRSPTHVWRPLDSARTAARAGPRSCPETPRLRSGRTRSAPLLSGYPSAALGAPRSMRGVSTKRA
jgi:hypothetical protein